MVWESQGRGREALRCTLDILRSPPADPHPRQTAITPVTRGLALNNLGWYHARLGELSEARSRCEQALQLFRDIDFPYGEATTLDSLGYIYRLLGDHDRAVAYYRLVADQFRQIGDLHELAQVLGRLGDSCQAVSDTAAARDAWQQAGHIMDSLRHPDAEQIHAKLRRLNSLSSQAG
jgi:tetratricopeptide (TPR) repeat protein